ncbi:MAG: hypothetical protein U0228_31645 [Myxococcaceae bacterium]
MNSLSSRGGEGWGEEENPSGWRCGKSGTLNSLSSSEERELELEEDS